MAIVLELNERKVIAPVLMVPGHADGCVTVYLGHGRRRRRHGRVGQGVGFNAYTLRTSTSRTRAGGLTVTKGKGTYDLCVTKVHAMENRGCLRAARPGKEECSRTRGRVLAAGPRSDGARHHPLRHARRSEAEPRLRARRGAGRKATRHVRHREAGRARRQGRLQPAGRNARARREHVPRCVEVRPHRQVRAGQSCRTSGAWRST